MSIQTKAVLTAYFNSADKPVEANYTALIDSCYQGYLSKYIDLHDYTTSETNKIFYIPLGNPANTYTLYKIYVFGQAGASSTIDTTITYKVGTASNVSIVAANTTTFDETGSFYFDKNLVATAIPANALIKIEISEGSGIEASGVLILYSVAT